MAWNNRGFGGAKIGASIIKGAHSLPPLQRAGLGVITAGSGALAIGLAGSAVKIFRKNSEISGTKGDVEVSIPKSVLAEIEKGNIDKNELFKKVAEGVEKISDNTNSSTTASFSCLWSVPLVFGHSGKGKSKGREGTVQQGASQSTGSISGTSVNSMSSSDKIINSGIDGSGDGGGSFIASVSDYSDSLSPLEILINYELLINTMILFHIIIICFILLKNYNIKIISNGGVSLISKITNKYKLNKLQFIIDKLSNMSKNYLLLLLIINVLILLFYIFLNIYILNELSNNLNEYIYAYNKINKGVVLLLASPSARGARVAWGGGGGNG